MSHRYRLRRYTLLIEEAEVNAHFDEAKALAANEHAAVPWTVDEQTPFAHTVAHAEGFGDVSTMGADDEPMTRHQLQRILSLIRQHTPSDAG